MGVDLVFVLLFVPIFRMVTKKSSEFNWAMATGYRIIGSGMNAQEAYKAINSEHNLGLNIVGFIHSNEGEKLEDILKECLFYAMI